MASTIAQQLIDDYEEYLDELDIVEANEELYDLVSDICINIENDDEMHDGVYRFKDGSVLELKDNVYSVY